ncbi:cell wall-binding repeat-containing protein [Modestobacter sp. SYSU DS0875]
MFGRRSLTVGAAAAALIIGAAGTAHAAPYRMGTDDVYANAAQMALLTAGDPAENSGVAVIASGSDPADVLMAPVVAHAMRVDDGRHQWEPPVLLVPTKGAMPAVVTSALRQMELDHIVVLGGTNKVSSATEKALRSYAGTVERINGVDRYETAAQVSQRFEARNDIVFLLSGEVPQEAEAGMGAALQAGGTVLLSQKASLPPATEAELRRLQPSRVVLIGNTGVLSGSVLTQVRSITPGAVVQRIAGADRYETNVEALRTVGWEPINVVLVSGEMWQPALSAVPYTQAQQSEYNVLLTRKACVPGPTLDYIDEFRMRDNVLVVGGTAMVSDAAANLRRC